MNTIIFNILPSQEGLNSGVTHNAIRYYTRACYSVWEAEGTPSEDGDATLYFNDDDSVGIIENGAVRTIDNVGVRNDILIYGPYYAQLVFYTGLADSAKRIPYRASFRLKIDTIGTQPPNSNDTICILQVTTSHLNRITWNFDSTQVINYRVVTFGELASTYDTFNVNYDYRYVDTLFTTDTSQFRAQADYVEFKVLWKGNSNKVRLYVDKVIVSDDRGRELKSGSVDQDIRDQIDADLETFSSGRVAGWEGAGDELGFIDQFEPIRVVDSIVTQNGNGRSLWLSAGTGYNGRWDSNVGPGEINPIGIYKLFTFDEFYKRVGKANIWSDYYLYGVDDGTWGPYEYRDVKIRYMLDSVNSRFNKP